MGNRLVTNLNSVIERAHLTGWSLSNAFTIAFKDLEPIPQYKATAKLAGFLQSVRPLLPFQCKSTHRLSLNQARGRTTRFF